MISSKNSVLGIDIGTSNIKIVHLKKKQKYRLINWAAIQTPENTIENGNILDKNKLIKVIKTAVKQNKFKEKKTVTAISNYRVITRYITMPEMPFNELKEAVKWEARNHIPIYNENMLVDFKIIGKTGYNKLKIVLAGVSRNISLEYLNILQGSGLDPVAIDIYPVALNRCFSALNTEDPYCIIDFGASQTKLIIIKNGEIYADNLIHFGSREIEKSIVEYFGVTQKEVCNYRQKISFLPTLQKNEFREFYEYIIPLLNDLTAQINRFLNFYSSQNRGERIKQLVLTGGGMNWKGFEDFITREVGIPSISDFNLDNFEINFKSLNINKEQLHLLSNAIGLAMRGAVI
ncbi:MAG: type pilus assembly protein PilM [Thermosediminibacterales bacterium]|nr:type pilus assembly protein PilM [Thermosediminibacterales bacterium]